MHSDDESTAPIPIVPARRSRWSPGRTALVATIVVLLLGAVSVLVRHLCELGLDAQGFNTEYGDDEEDVIAATGEDAS